MSPASSKSMQNAEATPSVPNVIIGVTPSPSSVSEIPPASAKTDAAVQLELPSQPSTPPLRDTLKAPALTDTIVDEPAPESAKAEAPNLHDTIIDAQKIDIVNAEEPAKSESPKPSFERTLPFGSARDFAEPAKPERVEEEPAKEEPKLEAKADRAKELPAAVAQDEETIPPAGDLAVAEQFFSEGDLSRHASVDDDLDSIATDEKAQRKSDPEVVQRRAKFAKVVTWAVGVSAALCLVAGVKMAFSSKSIASANAANAPAKTEMAAKTPPPPVATPAAKAAEPAAVAAAPAEAPQPVVVGDVKEEKAKVKAALDKNKLADAIEAGERAVAIDETDSEAWLLLGAAYHAKGQLKDAQRAYHACVEKGIKDKFQRECRLFAR